MNKPHLLYHRILIFVFTFVAFGIQPFNLSSQQLIVSKPDNQYIIWDVQLNINLTEGKGAEFDGNFFYVTHGLSNLINKYDLTGTLIESFSIPGVNNLSDIVFDGTFMYGGTGSQTIYQMDFVSKTLVGTITSPVNIRHISYDENNDAFWVGSWSDPLILITRSGTVLNSYMTMLPFITGTAYDNVTPGGPYLWIFDAGNTIPGPQLIHQFHLPSGTFTGLTHDVLSDVGIGQPDAVAGGLFSTSELVQGTFSLGGILVGSPTILFAYEILNPIPVELTGFKAEYYNGEVKLSWQTMTEVNNKGFEIERSVKIPRRNQIKDGGEEENWGRIGFVPGYGTTTQPKSYTFIDDRLKSGHYLYRLKQIDFNGSFIISEIVEVIAKFPEDFVLEQNYPNPFNPNTKISWQSPVDSWQTLKVYDVLGNELATLVDEEKTPGTYEVEYTVAQDSSPEITSGVYFYQLKTESFIETKKMLLLK